MSLTEYCTPYASFFGFAGVASAMIFSSLGAAYGTAKAGIGIAGVGQFNQALIMKSLIPVVMSGIIAVYGLVMAVLISSDLTPTENYSLFNGFVHLAAGSCVGLTGLAAGYTIGIVGDAGVRSFLEQPRIFVSMVLVLIFAEGTRPDEHGQSKPYANVLSSRTLRIDRWSDSQHEDDHRMLEFCTGDFAANTSQIISRNIAWQRETGIQRL